MNSKYKIQPIAVAISLASVYTVSYADQQQGLSSVHQLAPIVVTAQQEHDNNGLIVIANPKQPIQPIPAADGAAYLKSIMGFSAVQSGGTNGDVSFRGMFGSRIKVLSDGSESLGACPSRMDAPTAYISPESFDKITVIKGPQTVQYANPGSAATVLFERKAPQLSSLKPYQGQASVVAGSYGRLDQNVESIVGQEQLYARLNASHSRSGDYQDGNGQTVHSNWDKWNTDLAVGWTPNADTWLELSGGLADGEAAYAGRNMDGSQFKRESLGLHLEKKNISPVIKKINAQIDYSYNDHIMDNYSLRTAPTVQMMGMSMANQMAMTVTRRTINSRFNISSEWDKFNLITGVDSQYNQHGGDMYSSAMPSMNSPFTEDLRFQSYGGFAEMGYRINAQHKLVTGARLDRISVRHQQTQQKRQDVNPSGFIRLESTLDNASKLYIGLGYVERSPDYWELYSTSTDTGQSTRNLLNHLNTEKTTQLDFGFEQNHHNWKTWASFYAGIVHDFILINYNTTQSQALATNVDAQIAGAEAGAAYQFNTHLQADVSAMYAWGENTTDNKPLPQIAPLEGRFNLRYVADDFSIGLLWRAVAKQNRIAINEGNIVGYDLKPSKAFNTLALNASYQFSDEINLSMGIDNLLDQDYVEHLNKAGAATFGYASTMQFNQPGRNYWTRLSFKF